MRRRAVWPGPETREILWSQSSWRAATKTDTACYPHTDLKPLICLQQISIVLHYTPRSPFSMKVRGEISINRKNHRKREARKFISRQDRLQISVGKQGTYVVENRDILNVT